MSELHGRGSIVDLTLDGALQTRITLSENIWLLRWSDYFPLEFEVPGFHCSIISPHAALHFAKQNHSKIFSENQGQNFISDSAHPAKFRFYEKCADFFGLFKTDELIGIAICNPSDWSTYYLRYFTVLPEFTGLGMISALVEHLCKILSNHGVQRAEAEFSPNNSMTQRFTTKLGFEVSGLSLSERYGSLVRTTKFLNLESADSFHSQFCNALPRQLNQGKFSGN